MPTVDFNALDLSHAELVAVLYHMYKANKDPGEESKIRSRFKNLQRVGLPCGLRPGRGSHQSYEFEQVCEFILAFELSEFGISPRAIYENFYETYDFENGPARLLPRLLMLKTKLNYKEDYFLAFRSSTISGHKRYETYQILGSGLINKEDALWAISSSRCTGCINLSRVLNELLYFYPKKNLDNCGIAKPQLRSGMDPH